MLTRKPHFFTSIKKKVGVQNFMGQSLLVTLVTSLLVCAEESLYLVEKWNELFSEVAKSCLL